MSNRVDSWGDGKTPPTTEERRDAAAKLREMVGHGLYGYSVMSALENVTGEARVSGIFTRLADLVEPAPERTCEVDSATYDEHWGQYELHLTCGHEIMSDEPESKYVRYCCECGARIAGWVA